ncbi:hypothetical protein AVEN_1637-1 [Araneus ventricosus]|uniref:Uncharacterized protein n=1 Tax=Araneus ventricosus TaxID=182803 RepID=A0A4Y2UEE8_ARAVE|nr:hypothetical protein AVEN_1637-1 [Araneus ventricosus]
MVNTRSQKKMDDNAELLADMKKSMEAGQKEVKIQIQAGKEEMKAHVESQVEEMKEHVNRCIEKIEEDIQAVKGEIEEVKGDVLRKITGVEDKIQGNIRVLEKRISYLGIRPNNFPVSPELMYSRLMYSTDKRHGLFSRLSSTL